LIPAGERLLEFLDNGMEKQLKFPVCDEYSVSRRFSNLTFRWHETNEQTFPTGYDLAALN